MERKHLNDSSNALTAQLLIARLPDEFKGVRERLQTFPGGQDSVGHQGPANNAPRNFQTYNNQLLIASSNKIESRVDRNPENVNNQLPQFDEQQQQPQFLLYAPATSLTIPRTSDHAALPSQVRRPAQQSTTNTRSGPENATNDGQAATSILQGGTSAPSDTFDPGAYIEAQPFSFMPNRVGDQQQFNAAQDDSGAAVPTHGGAVYAGHFQLCQHGWRRGYHFWV